MKLTLDRKYKKKDYTIGHLYIGDEYYCDTMEDRDRGLTSDMTEEEIFDKKVYGSTAIPTGIYNLSWTYSPKYKKYMIAVDGVKGFSGIRIHAGNTQDDTLGCILVGKNKERGKLFCSISTIMQLNTIIKTAIRSGQKIQLEVK